MVFGVRKGIPGIEEAAVENRLSPCINLHLSMLSAVDLVSGLNKA